MVWARGLHHQVAAGRERARERPRPRGWVIEEAHQKPTLVLAHNRTLAAQLYAEFPKSFFPDNAVEYFVSYFDYYQPEAYLPRSSTPTSRRTRLAMTRLTNCAMRPPTPSSSVVTSSSWPRCPVSMAWGLRSIMELPCCAYAKVAATGAMPCCVSSWICSISATTRPSTPGSLPRAR